MATIPAKAIRRKHRSVLPGFGLTLGFATLYLSIIVLLPLSTVFVKSAGMGPEAFAHAAFNTRTLLAYRLSFGAAAAAAAITRGEDRRRSSTHFAIPESSKQSPM